MSVPAVNVNDTYPVSAKSVCGCPSWIAHWRKHSGSTRNTCMAIGCQEEAVVGAHVHEPKRKTHYIIGLCKSHNHPSNAEAFDVDERTRWVLAKRLDGCGP